MAHNTKLNERRKPGRLEPTRRVSISVNYVWDRRRGDCPVSGEMGKLTKPLNRPVVRSGQVNGVYNGPVILDSTLNLVYDRLRRQKCQRREDNLAMN